MSRKLLLTLCLVLGLTFVACDSDDGEEDTTDAAADTGDSTGDSTTDTDTDTDTDMGDTADATETTDAPDTMDIPVDMGMSACAPLNDPTDVTVTYDAFTVLGFVGTAEVAKTGPNVVVTVEDEMFTGEFEAGSNCVPPQQGLLFPLCFMTPDGFPAEPETLGPVLITGPNDTVGIVAAHRRGVDRTCAASGQYLLTPGTVDVMPMDTDQAFIDEIMDEYSQYIMVFELPEQTVAIMGQEQAFTVNPFQINPMMDGFADFTFMQALGGNADDWGVTVSGTNGTLNGNDMTFDLQFEVMGLENHMGVNFTINVPMTGVRQ